MESLRFYYFHLISLTAHHVSSFVDLADIENPGTNENQGLFDSHEG